MSPTTSVRHQRRAILVSLAFSLLGPGAAAARAHTPTVTDGGDTTPGGAPGQLRRLMNDAVAGDTILVPACTISLFGSPGDDANQQGDLDVTKDVAIVGAGAASTTLAGGFNLSDRILHVLPGVTADISGVTISNVDWNT